MNAQTTPNLRYTIRVDFETMAVDAEAAVKSVIESFGPGQWVAWQPDVTVYDMLDREVPFSEWVGAKSSPSPYTLPPRA